MKRALLIWIVFACCSSGHPPMQRDGNAKVAKTSCALSTLKGSYGITVSGTNVHAGAYAIVGRIILDGLGSLKGSVTQSVNGVVFGNGVTGTYTVADNCTGSVKIVFGTGDSSSLNLVIVRNGAKVLLIDTDRNTVETGYAERD